MVDTPPPLPHLPGRRNSEHTGAMSSAELQTIIDAAWDARETVNATTAGATREAVEAALDGLDGGKLRVAEKIDGKWQVHQWLKKAVLLSFRLTEFCADGGDRAVRRCVDKVSLKFAGWGANRFREAGFRAVPGAVVRRSAFVAPGVVLMPCLRQCRRLCR